MSDMMMALMGWLIIATCTQSVYARALATLMVVVHLAIMFTILVVGLVAGIEVS